jgi:exopolysaccharide biosynthesis polyprenyl glycosylphosphotransferase
MSQVERSTDRLPSAAEPATTRHLFRIEPRSYPSGRRVHPTTDPSTVKRWLILADVVAVLTAVVVALLVQQTWSPVGLDGVRVQWLVLVASSPFWFASALVNNLYAARANQRRLDEYKNIVMTAIMGVGSMIAVAFVFQQLDLRRSWVLTLFVAVVVALVIEREGARVVFHRLRRSGNLSRPVLVVGTDDNAAALARTVQERPELGYRAVGFVGSRPTDTELHGVPLLGDLSRVEDAAAESGATGVLISLYSVDGPTVNALSRRLTDAGLHVTLVSSLHDIDIHRLRLQQIDNRALLYIEPTIRTGWRYIAMRMFDYSVALVGLLLTLPILAVAMLAIRLDSKGPAIFRQVRTGVNGQHFEILKLRTMVDGADSMKAELMEHNEKDGPLFKIEDDPRVTRVGRILRKFSIDELPQFWNVVRGEMSVVGPRPALPSEVAQWEDDVHERLRVLPGITGIWQVSGRSDTTFEDYKRLDHYYVDNWSLAHDIRIVVKTLGVVLSRRGAS